MTWYEGVMICNMRASQRGSRVPRSPPHYNTTLQHPGPRCHVTDPPHISCVCRKCTSGFCQSGRFCTRCTESTRTDGGSVAIKRAMAASRSAESGSVTSATVNGSSIGAHVSGGSMSGERASTAFAEGPARCGDGGGAGSPSLSPPPSSEGYLGSGGVEDDCATPQSSAPSSARSSARSSAPSRVVVSRRGFERGDERVAQKVLRRDESAAQKIFRLKIRRQRSTSPPIVLPVMPRAMGTMFGAKGGGSEGGQGGGGEGGEGGSNGEGGGDGGGGGGGGG